MTFSIVGTPQTFGFADGNAGHVCTNSDGGPSTGQWDILFVNSDTVVSTPSGFNASVSAVTNQGAYVFTRKSAGGESASVTVTTAGNFNCHVIWVRLAGADTVDVTGSAQTNSSPGGTTSPSFTSSALAASGEIGLAFSALHSFNGSFAPASPDWSGSSYTAITGGTTGGTTSSACGGFVAYKTPVGTAAESPSMSFTNGCANRYMLFVSLTAAAGGSTLSADATLAATATVTSTAAVDRSAASAGPTTTAAIAAAATVARAASASFTATVAITATASVTRNASASLTVTATASATSEDAARNATSTATVTARRTSTVSVSAGRSSTPTVSGG